MTALYHTAVKFIIICTVILCSVYYTAHIYIYIYNICICTPINVVAYPVELLTVEAENNTIQLTWEPSSIVADFTTGYIISCITLMKGIPQPEVQTLPPNETLTAVSAHYGVSYTCEIFAVTAQGTSSGRSVNITIPETGLSECYAYLAPVLRL